MVQKDRYETVSCGLSIEEMDLQRVQEKESRRSHACITRSSLCRDCKVSRGKLEPDLANYLLGNISIEQILLFRRGIIFFFLFYQFKRERERGSVDNSFEIWILRINTLPFLKIYRKTVCVSNFLKMKMKSLKSNNLSSLKWNWYSDEVKIVESSTTMIFFFLARWRSFVWK